MSCYYNANAKARDGIETRTRQYPSQRKKTGANARSNTVQSKKTPPKSKSEMKEKREAVRAERQSEIAERKAAVPKGSGGHHNPPKAKSEESSNPFALTEEEQIQKKKVEAAIASVKKPRAGKIAERALVLYERELVGSKSVEVIDSFGMRRALSEGMLADMFYAGCDGGYRFSPSKKTVSEATEQLVLESNDVPELLERFRYDEKRSGTKRGVDVVVESILTRSKVKTVRDKVTEQISFARWLSHVAENPNCLFAKPYAQAMETVSKYDLRSYLPPDTERRFVVDVGPTNSGKTYSGMCELIEAESGVYLGPLRLLAMEAADTMNESGCPCSLLTGEERNDVEGARHVASTVEMLSRDTHYDVAVIDECQMITDPERGYAWAAAITSVNADIVHLCVAPEAYELVCSILDGLDADYETEYHDRLVPLEAMKRTVKYPGGIKKGDALIVFSRKSVQRYASELGRHGIKASIVYGALPYDVRKEEVRKFAEGETDVVVATDAIGMGMNLPVQRVIFAETEKFDGHRMRELLDTEIKQIAGRAGRFGKYDIGYVSVLKGCNRALVLGALEAEYESRSEIRVDMPGRLLDEASSPLSLLMRAWQMTPVEHPYVKRNLAQQISLARRVEDLPNDFVADAVEIPFKSGDRFVPLDDIWEKHVRAAYAGEPFETELYPISAEDSLEHLEDAAKLADLSYGLAKRYGSQEDIDRIDEHRTLVSEYMIEVLRNRTEESRKCAWCGRPLAASSQHAMHDRCYREYRADKYARWDERYYGEQHFHDDDEYDVLALH